MLLQYFIFGATPSIIHKGWIKITLNSICTKPLSPKKSVSTSFLLIFRTVSVYYFSVSDDDEEPTFKERMLENIMKFIDIMCVWDCCWLWLQLQKYVGLLVFDPFVELFITLCIVVNTLFMALDHHDMNPDLEKALKSGNYVSLRELNKNNPMNKFPFFSSLQQHFLLKQV